MKTLRLIAILILFLAGCAAPTALPTDAVTQPTATLVVVASATAQPSATATLVPTVTLQPTAIPATSTPDALQGRSQKYIQECKHYAEIRRMK